MQSPETGFLWSHIAPIPIENTQFLLQSVFQMLTHLLQFLHTVAADRGEQAIFKSHSDSRCSTAHHSAPPGLISPPAGPKHLGIILLMYFQNVF